MHQAIDVSAAPQARFVAVEVKLVRGGGVAGVGPPFGGLYARYNPCSAMIRRIVV